MQELKAHHTIIDLDLETVKQGIEQGSILLIDIREPYEFTAGHIPGSVSLPLSQFDLEALPKAPKSRSVFVCAAGVRSEKLLIALQEAGLDYQEHYRGGFKEWQLKGETIEY